MRVLLAALLGTTFLGACAAMDEKIDVSRQDRCARANWSDVGQRDGIEAAHGMADRYAHICGDMFQPEPYQEGYAKGNARRARPPV
jgi:hypothetical protein